MISGQPLGRREALHRLGQVGVGVAVAGERAQHRHDPVEPEREEGRERRAGRVGDLEDHEPPAGLEHPGQLGDAASRSARLRTPKPTVTASKLASLVGQRRARRPTRTRRGRAALGRLLARQISSIRSEKSQPTTLPVGPDAPRAARARGRRSRSRRRGRCRPARARRDRRRARASGGEARRSSPSSSGRRRPRCGRTCPGPGRRTRRIARCAVRDGAARRHASLQRGEELDQVVELLSGRHEASFAPSVPHGANTGMIPDGLISVRLIACAGSFAPISVSSGPGRRCRSRRTCGRPGSPTEPRPACRPRTAAAPRGRSRSASRRRRRDRSGTPSRRSS